MEYRLAVRLTPEQKARLFMISSRTGLTPSELIRAAIEAMEMPRAKRRNGKKCEAA